WESLAVVLWLGVRAEEFFQPSLESVQGLEHLTSRSCGFLPGCRGAVLGRWRVVGEQTPPEVPEVGKCRGLGEVRAGCAGGAVWIPDEKEVRLQLADVSAQDGNPGRGR